MVNHDAIWPIQQGTKDDLTDTIYEADGTVADLTGETVTLHYKHPVTLVVLPIVATIVTPLEGKVKFSTINAGISRFLEVNDYPANIIRTIGTTVKPTESFILRVSDTQGI